MFPGLESADFLRPQDQRVLLKALFKLGPVSGPSLPVELFDHDFTDDELVAYLNKQFPGDGSLVIAVQREQKLDQDHVMAREQERSSTKSPRTA
jgi:hypothetical protein